jgi:hypothetical protein
VRCIGCSKVVQCVMRCTLHSLLESGWSVRVWNADGCTCSCSLGCCRPLGGYHSSRGCGDHSLPPEVKSCSLPYQPHRDKHVTHRTHICDTPQTHTMHLSHTYDTPLTHLCMMHLSHTYRYTIHLSHTCNAPLTHTCGTPSTHMRNTDTPSTHIPHPSRTPMIHNTVSRGLHLHHWQELWMHNYRW